MIKTGYMGMFIHPIMGLPYKGYPNPSYFMEICRSPSRSPDGLIKYPTVRRELHPKYPIHYLCYQLVMTNIAMENPHF